MAQRRPDRVLDAPHDTFWTFCDAGELWMQECQDCAHVQWPPVARSCEHCESEDVGWRRLSGLGRLVSWCTFERSYYSELPVPWETIVVELDEGPLFISNPFGFTAETAALGERVEVRFVDCEDNGGHFRLPVFARRAPHARSAAGRRGCER